MKKESHRILLIESLLALICLIFIVFDNLYKTWTYIGALVIPLIVSLILLKPNYREERISKDTLLTLLIGLILYYLIIYILGYFTGFYNNPYSLHPLGILLNIFTTATIIIITEYTRVMILKKGKYSKKLIILAFFIFSLLEIIIKVKLNTIDTKEEFLETLFTIVLPIMSKNILLTFVGYYTSVFNNLCYCFMMELPMFFIPIQPDLGEYLSNTFLIVQPLLLVYIINKQYFINDKKIKNSRKDLHKDQKNKLLTVILVIMLGIIVTLVSGIARYYALTIGSSSMTGTINKGDVIIIDQKDRNISKGQIIAFKKEDHILVHRVVKVQKINNKIYYQTKGDYNKSKDNWLVEENEIVGTYKFHFKYIGWPTVKLNEWILGGD